jgi:tetratricopeptide (TPR) repeat protein
MKTYLTLIVVVIFLFTTPVYSVEYGSVNKDSAFVDYKSIDTSQALKRADLYFGLAQTEADEVLKSAYLEKAKYEYNVLSLAKFDDIHSVIQLGRIYDVQKQDRYAKSYFSRALGLDYKNPSANYYFANFYYDRKDYKKALKYYRKAMEYGLPDDINLLKNMGDIFEKFADIKRANICYKRAFLIDPSNEYIADKIREMEEVNYNSADYYNRRNSR